MPQSKHIAEFQEIINSYREANDIHVVGGAEDFFVVKDVAIKKGSGTASMGLDRFYILINGPTDDPKDNVILECKQTRRSALYGLTGNGVIDNGLTNDEDGDRAIRVVRSHEVHLVGGDPFYGHITIDGRSFLLRERSPYKDDIDVSQLSFKEFCEYATICGYTIAQTHARSDEDTGIMEGNAEEAILSSIEPELFTADMLAFAHAAAKQLQKDWKLFKKDYKLGAFRFYNRP